MKKEVWIIETDEDFKKEKLVKKIKKENHVDLKKHFHDNNSEGMARILGDNAVLTSPEGIRYYGGEGEYSLGAYWRGAISDFEDVEFELICVHVRDAIRDPKKVDPKKKILHVAYEISNFHLIRREGESLTNHTGSYGRSIPHIDPCEWEP